MTVESLHVESTDRGWEAQPGPRSGPISRSGDANGAVAEGVSVASSVDVLPGGGSGGGDVGDEGRDRLGDRLVKKEIQLNHLACYWNPAEDGNPCSMYLSDIPVEQAEVVISR